MPILIARRSRLALAVTILGGGLAGCTTSADFTYSEYQFGPGFQTERVYENRVYSDTGRGLGSENCRAVVRRQVNAFGEPTTREETVCSEF